MEGRDWPVLEGTCDWMKGFVAGVPQPPAPCSALDGPPCWEGCLGSAEPSCESQERLRSVRDWFPQSSLVSGPSSLALSKSRLIAVGAPGRLCLHLQRTRRAQSSRASLGLEFHRGPPGQG